MKEFHIRSLVLIDRILHPNHLQIFRPAEEHYVAPIGELLPDLKKNGKGFCCHVQSLWRGVLIRLEAFWINFLLTVSYLWGECPNQYESVPNAVISLYSEQGRNMSSVPNFAPYEIWANHKVLSRTFYCRHCRITMMTAPPTTIPTTAIAIVIITSNMLVIMQPVEFTTSTKLCPRKVFLLCVLL